MTDNRKFRVIVQWLLMIVVILFIVTGLGITEYRTVEAITGGLLSKNLSFQIHSWLLWPLVILLALHIYPATKRLLFRSEKHGKNK